MTDISTSGYGAALRRRREELALSLEDLAASTRIRKTYLHALEEENVRALPGEVYAVGFLRIYAQQLSLPIEPLLAAMTGAEKLEGGGDASASGNQRRQSSLQAKSSRRRKRPLFLLLLLVAVVAVYVALWANIPPERPLPTKLSAPAHPVRPIPPPPQPAVATPPTEPSPATEQSGGARSPELPVIPPAGAIVRMLPIAAGTMKVSLDRQELRDYELQPEQALNWKVNESLTVELAAPGLVRVWVDQQELTIAEYQAFTLKRVGLQETRP